MIVSSERLHTFAVFAEDQNLSHAAKRLHLSQPAVHAQLKALSDELRVTLYQRVGRGLMLTKEGIEVAAFARDMAERSQDLLQRLHSDDSHAQRLVLATGAGALVYLLARGMRAFHRSRQKVRPPRVEVITADASQSTDLVRRGLAHVGVGVLDKAPVDLEARTLAKAAQVVVLPRDHRLAHKRNVTLADLANEEIIAPPEGGPQRNALDMAFAMKGLALRASAVARGWDVVLKLVELDVGIGIVNDTCEIPGALVSRPLRELPPVTYLAFTRPRPREDVSRLVDALIDGARRHP